LSNIDHTHSPPTPKKQTNKQTNKQTKNKNKNKTQNKTKQNKAKIKRRANPSTLDLMFEI